jgi:hypothetical protein
MLLLHAMCQRTGFIRNRSQEADTQQVGSKAAVCLQQCVVIELAPKASTTKTTNKSAEPLWLTEFTHSAIDTPILPNVHI